MNTHAGQRLAAILDGYPYHLNYEEGKRSASIVPNLNPYLRQQLNGMKKAFPAIPGPTECDVVYPLIEVRTWMECKLVQTHNGGNKVKWRFEDKNKDFEKYLFYSCICDVRDRLPTLDGSSDADRIAFLMVAYDSPRWPIDGAIQRFVQLGGLASWAHDVIYSQPDPRDRAKAEHARIQVLYWERPVVV